MELQVRFWPISCRLCLFAEITLTKSHFCESCLRLNHILSSDYGRSNLCLAVLKMPSFSIPSCSFSALPKQHWDDQKWFSCWTLETLLASCSNTSTMLQWPDKRWRGIFSTYTQYLIDIFMSTVACNQTISVVACITTFTLCKISHLSRHQDNIVILGFHRNNELYNQNHLYPMEVILYCG